jgi:pyruvate carboxylase
MFGDIVKVTPSSKVVGDMAQFMVANGLTRKDVYEKGHTISFPESVLQFFSGEIGQPEGGFPVDLQRIILKDKQPLTERANKYMPAVDFDKELKAFQEKYGEDLTLCDFLSYKFYPKVYEEGLKFWREYGDVSVIPTPLFLYGMKLGEDTTISIAKGKTLLIRLLSIGPADEHGKRTVFFKLNGQTRNVEISDRSLQVKTVENRKVDKDNDKHIGAPLQGLLSKVLVEKNTRVKKNQPLFIIEAMKMETVITAPCEADINHIELIPGTLVNTNDLVLELN